MRFKLQPLSHPSIKRIAYLTAKPSQSINQTNCTQNISRVTMHSCAFDTPWMHTTMPKNLHDSTFLGVFLTPKNCCLVIAVFGSEEHPQKTAITKQQCNHQADALSAARHESQTEMVFSALSCSRSSSGNDTHTNNNGKVIRTLMVANSQQVVNQSYYQWAFG